jgi:hypothetical protein
MKIEYSDRALLALDALDRSGRDQARALIDRAAANPEAGEMLTVAIDPKALRMRDARAVRVNRTNCARSIAAIYRSDGDRLTIVDLLELPPIPAPEAPQGTPP